MTFGRMVVRTLVGNPILYHISPSLLLYASHKVGTGKCILRPWSVLSGDIFLTGSAQQELGLVENFCSNERGGRGWSSALLCCLVLGRIPHCQLLKGYTCSEKTLSSWSHHSATSSALGFASRLSFGRKKGKREKSLSVIYTATKSIAYNW